MGLVLLAVLFGTGNTPWNIAIALGLTGLAIAAQTASSKVAKQKENDQ